MENINAMFTKEEDEMAWTNTSKTENIVNNTSHLN